MRCVVGWVWYVRVGVEPTSTASQMSPELAYFRQVLAQRLKFDGNILTLERSLVHYAERAFAHFRREHNVAGSGCHVRRT